MFPVLRCGVRSYSFLSTLKLRSITAILLCGPSQDPLRTKPYAIAVTSFSFSLGTSPLPRKRLLNELCPSKIVLTPRKAFDSKRRIPIRGYHCVVQIRRVATTHVQSVRRILGGVIHCSNDVAVIRARMKLLSELRILVNGRARYEAKFSLNVTIVINVLLATLTSVRFHRGRCICALVGDFKIHPMLLVVTFVIRGTFLVNISFTKTI